MMMNVFISKVATRGSWQRRLQGAGRWCTPNRCSKRGILYSKRGILYSKWWNLVGEPAGGGALERLLGERAARAAAGAHRHRGGGGGGGHGAAAAGVYLPPDRGLRRDSPNASGVLQPQPIGGVSPCLRARHRRRLHAPRGGSVCGGQLRRPLSAHDGRRCRGYSW